MSISIYYRFKSESNLTKTDHLQHVVDAWNKEFNGNPYEEWSWYDTELVGDLFIHEGSTKMPMDEDTFPDALMKSLELLSDLRNSIGGGDWSVNMDDMEIPWDDARSYYQLEAKMKTKNKLVINIIVMFILSIILVFMTSGLLVSAPDIQTSYGAGYIVGRAIFSAIFPLLVVSIPAGIYKAIWKKPLPGFYIILWIIWALLFLLALLGNIIKAM